MGRGTSSNDSVSWGRRVFDSTVHLAANLAHNKLFVYVLIALAMSVGVGKWDDKQRNIQAKSDHRALVQQQEQDYNLCKGIEQVKAQIERELAKLVDKATPLPRVDCTPLRPSK